MDTDKIVAATTAIRRAAQKYAVESADPDARIEIQKEVDILRPAGSIYRF